MDEIRGAGKVTRKAYSYTVTESLGPRNEEVRHLRRSYTRVLWGNIVGLRQMANFVHLR